MQPEAGANPNRLVGRGALALRLAAAFVDFSGPRAALACGLVIVGAGVEGLGLMLVAPFLGLLTLGPSPATRSWIGAIVVWCRRASPVSPVLPLMIGFAAIVITRSIVVVARDRSLATLHLGFMETLRDDLAHALASCEWTTLARLGHARVSNTLGLGVERCGAAVSALLQLATSAALLVGAAAVAIILSPRLTTLTLAILSLAILLVAPALAKARAAGDEVGAAGEALAASVGGFLGGLKLTLAHGRSGGFVEAFETNSHALAQSRLRFSIDRSRAGAAANLLVAVATAAILWAGAGPLALSPALLLAFLVLTARLTGPALAAQRALLDVTSDISAYGDFRDLMTELSARAALYPRLTPERAAGGASGVALAAVVFRHPTGRGLGPADLVIQPGLFLGVEGPSGAGKTTLADLLAGLVEPQSGEVRIDGVPLNGRALARWRESLAYVTQDPFLFHETLRANLSWARAEAGEAAMWRALDLAEAADVARALPEGLDTPLGERGGLVSGGERQRFALARALLREPAMLILDEALNAVDEDTELRILSNLAALRPRPMLLMIAHRRESLARCDKVVRLEDGLIVTSRASDRRARVV
jgi:ATP-binding cassette subfamily C protein